MRKRYLEDWIFYWIALAVKGFFGIFPYKIGVILGAGLIYLLSFFYSRRFDIAYLNLKSAFPDKSPARIKWLVRRSIFNLGLSLMEFVLLSKLSEEKFLKLVKVEGVDILNKETSSDRGIIFLTAHYNSWELLPFLSAILGYPSYVIAREQKYPHLNQLLNRYRSRWGCVVVEKGFSLKIVFRVLKDGKSIGILADQNAGRNGIQVKLFGRYASTNPGFIALARRTKAVVLPIFLQRIGLLQHRLKIYPQLDLDRADSEILADYNHILEFYISKNPEQWLWFHKRWKHSVNKELLLLSDGKPGHYKQSRLVAEELKHLLLKKTQDEWGIEKPSLTRITEVEIGWRSSIKRKLIYLIGLLSSKKSQGHLRVLRWALDSKSYQKLLSQKYDYIISAGSSLLAINAILSYENRAVNINILNPGLYKNKFRLIFLPQHDSLRGENIILYQGALSRTDLNKAELFQKSNSIKLEVGRLKIGVLIGGGSKGSNMDLASVKKLLAYLDAKSKEEDIDLLVTTSRRTPPEVEVLVKKYLGAKPYNKLLIIANENNPPGSFDALLTSSDIVIVTSDSISMISEALNCGRRVYVFKSGATAPKNERFINQLSNEGMLGIITVDDLDKGIDIGKISQEKCFDNEKIVREALRMLL